MNSKNVTIEDVAKSLSLALRRKLEAPWDVASQPAAVAIIEYKMLKTSGKMKLTEVRKAISTVVKNLTSKEAVWFKGRLSGTISTPYRGYRAVIVDTGEIVKVSISIC